MDKETVLVVSVGGSIEMSFVSTEVLASGDTETWVLEAKFAISALFRYICWQSGQTSPVLST